MIMHMLSTIDNPHDPFTEWDEWFAYDERAGHHSTSILGRVAVVDDDLSDEMIQESLEEAIDTIVYENFNGLFVKVSKDI